jgi:exonuclease III
MNILAWNCRGAGGPWKKQFLRDLLTSTRADIAFISETKRSSGRSSEYLRIMPLQHSEIVPATGRSGGLWLMWGNHIQLRIFQKTRYYIFAWVQTMDKPPWILVAVYGDASHRDNPRIWKYIINVAGWNRPMCCIGDFNAITSIEEKFGGSQRMNQNSRRFQEFIFQAGLIDLGFKGPAFTWTNKPNSSQGMHERLDQVLATSEWCTLFSDAYVNHMFRIHSDHAPIMLRTRHNGHGNAKFRIEHWWFTREDFSEA